ncbi:D-alanyl-D-alanine carboxypeptidase/D-alanyl-D-alanine-endopeptidase [Novosphingobium sp. 9U]|uniref:D-alanyl-D-alanine carboxypeptidase/D-alanyl-D-alanine endopeptidase n=1 Tax=Novosphingobium sp. 9U TaxID=2653158 RepID=UPI0012F1EF47|nr:D-alanyl-D-alanine carboxypeptidase/D-alanyl-D-alanine-endopeptidase [Novosphingobium sp. 9U]VWX51333.1 D-alanyl-D-alanine carboxypeptidase [Novosphingobium sp. 9U]
MPRLALQVLIGFALLPSPARADPLSEGVAAILAEAGPGTRWGMVVADEGGRELIALDPEGRYLPASNTKVLTTAAAAWALSGEAPVRLPASARGTSVRLDKASDDQPPDVVLVGHGDAQMSSAPDCRVDCLAELATQVAATGVRKVRDVIGDDTAFPDQRWSAGMSWNNIQTSSGTGVSALTLDNNEQWLSASATTPGQLAAINAPAYFTIDNRTLTVAEPTSTIGIDRLLGSRTLVVTGAVGPGRVANIRVGIDDPAEFTAWRFAALLHAAGVQVTGKVTARHRAALPQDDPELRGVAPPPAARAEPPALATLSPPPTSEDIVLTNKVSQNLHAELLLRQLGAVKGSGSVGDGLLVVKAMLAQAGVTPLQASASDGSGMSTYNRVAPRGMVRLLGWIAHQSWGAQWRASLPIGGQDGTLSRRFLGTSLADGKITAKTGTLNASNALAGYFTARSGKRLTFAIYANDVPDGIAATPLMDRALVYLADHS